MLIESLDAKWLESGADIRIAAEGKDAVSDAVRDDVDADLGNSFLDLLITADRAIDDSAERGTRGDRKRVHSNGWHGPRARPRLGRRKPRPSASGEAGELVCSLWEKAEKIREEFVEGF